MFSFNRLLDPVIDSPARPTFEVIEHMEVIDDYTIRFDLVSPSAFFPKCSPSTRPGSCRRTSISER